VLDFSDSTIKRFFATHGFDIQGKTYLREIICMKVHERKFLKLSLLKVSHAEVQKLILDQFVDDLLDGSVSLIQYVNFVSFYNSCLLLKV
jgi:hypothetical protein